MSEVGRKFSAEVKDVFSGDDLVLMVELGVNDLYVRKRVRLHGVDTPNAVGMGIDTEAGRIRGLVYDLTKRKRLVVEVMATRLNNWVGIVEIHGPEGVTNLNKMLVDKGYKFNRARGAQ